MEKPSDCHDQRLLVDFRLPTRQVSTADLAVWQMPATNHVHFDGNSLQVIQRIKFYLVQTSLLISISFNVASSAKSVGETGS